jgi:hypothetical protein
MIFGAEKQCVQYNPVLIYSEKMELEKSVLPEKKTPHQRKDGQRQRMGPAPAEEAAPAKKKGDWGKHSPKAQPPISTATKVSARVVCPKSSRHIPQSIIGENVVNWK